MKQVDPVVTENSEELDFLNVRKATEKDFPAIREVATLSRLASWGHFMTKEQIEEEVEHYYNDDILTAIIDNHSNATYVAERGGKILGYCSAIPKDRRGRPRLLQFYVRPDTQRQGVGELLFERAVNHLRAAGVTELLVSTIAENTSGRSFFEKKGLSLIQMYDSTWEGITHTIAVYHTSLK
ncbi:MAG: GNAT family N-acetyltransferase [Chloroflexota bacterium]|nr:GNAT family N-acetyltransferase [Chloroflexota bacterium]